MIPNWPHVLAAAMFGIVLWTALGWPIARRALPGMPGLAPVIGWSLHAVVSATLLGLVGFDWSPVVGLVLLIVVWTGHLRFPAPAPAVWLPWYVAPLALLGALAPAAAVMPHWGPAGLGLAGLGLAAPIFDHSKIALVDGLLRQGLPPVNPFYGGAAGPGLAYYYWWHLTAAALAQVSGLGGWGGDAAMTLVTAWASLMLMAGLGFAWQGRAGAVLAVVLAQLGSWRPLLAPWRLGWLRDQTGLGGWLNQASWAPQHVQSACCLVLAVLVAMRLAAGMATRQLAERVGLVALLGCVVAAGFGCSTWVGGITAAVVLAVVVPVLGTRVLGGAARAGFYGCCIAAAGLALLLVVPLLRDEAAAAVLRGGGAPVALAIYPVFAAIVPKLFNLPGLALLMLIEFPVLVVLGTLGLARVDRALAAAAWAAVAVCCCLASTIDNNDLGWRAILPALLIIVPAAAAELVRQWHRSRGLAVLLLMPGLLGLAGSVAQLREDWEPAGMLPAPLVQARLAGWAALRRVAGPAARVLDDPALDAGLARWPANLSWALLADRPSCYSGWATAHPFAPLPVMALYATDQEVARIYAGRPGGGDLADMVTRLHCRFALLTRQDAAWARDPFAGSAAWRGAAVGDGWRLYRSVIADQEGASPAGVSPAGVSPAGVFPAGAAPR